MSDQTKTDEIQLPAEQTETAGLSASGGEAPPSFATQRLHLLAAYGEAVLMAKNWADRKDAIFAELQRVEQAAQQAQQAAAE